MGMEREEFLGILRQAECDTARKIFDTLESKISFNSTILEVCDIIAELEEKYDYKT